MRPVVIDLDGVAAQPPLAERIADGRALRVEARDLAGKLRLLASANARQRLSARIAALGRRGAGPAIYFYGSGDFHHLCAVFLEAERTRLTVIQFDHHADWTRWPKTQNCGAWVCRALELDCVDKVIALGPCGADLDRPQQALADLAALRAGRIELYPWSRGPSRVWGDWGAGPGYECRDGALHWRTLAAEDWPAFLDELCGRIATRRVWITIDKDCLSPDEAITNWDQGAMPLARILDALAVFAGRLKIVGVDVCGDYSPARFSDPLRAALALFDHPRQPDAATVARAAAVNAATNARLIARFEELFA